MSPYRRSVAVAPRSKNSVTAASIALCINSRTPSRTTSSSTSPSSRCEPNRSSISARMRSMADARVHAGVGLLRELEGTYARRLFTPRTGRRPRQLFAHLLTFHQREQNAEWREYFSRLGLCLEELVEDGHCLGELHLEGWCPVMRPSQHHLCTFPAQDVSLRVGDVVIDPETKMSPGGSSSCDDNLLAYADDLGRPHVRVSASAPPDATSLSGQGCVTPRSCTRPPDVLDRGDARGPRGGLRTRGRPLRRGRRHRAGARGERRAGPLTARRSPSSRACFLRESPLAARTASTDARRRS